MADAQLPKWTDPRYQEKLAELWPHNASSDEFFKKDYTGRRICRADVSFKLKVDVKNNRHDRAILFVPIVPGVFHALCDSTVIGLN